MAGYWANAALWAQHWPDDLRLNNGALPDDLNRRVATGGLSRTITQASTLQVILANGDRTITSHWAANPFAAPAPRYSYGGLDMALVQIAKQADTVTITAEDAVINKLRGYTGYRLQAPGTRTRVQFAAQLCQEAGVPFVAEWNADVLQAPVSRGTAPVASTGTTTGTPTAPEDSWTCLNRLASDVGWYCFSDGTSVLFGPGYWLLHWGGAPAMTITERTGGIDVIDGSMDTGKPVTTLSVTGRASTWTADPGGWVRVTAGMGPFTGDWIVANINRQNLASDQIAVGLVAPTSVKREPAATTTTSTAPATLPAPLVEIDYGSVPDSEWNYLLNMGYTAISQGNREAVLVTPADLGNARQFSGGKVQ